MRTIRIIASSGQVYYGVLKHSSADPSFVFVQLDNGVSLQLMNVETGAVMPDEDVDCSIDPMDLPRLQELVLLNKMGMCANASSGIGGRKYIHHVTSC